MIRLYPTKLTKASLPELVQVISTLTQKMRLQQAHLLDQFDKAEYSTSKRNQLDEQINDVILSWRRKIVALGAVPHPFYEVEFETNNGDYYWKPGQTKVTKIKYPRNSA